MNASRHCFVPGCKSGYPNQRKEFKKKGKRNFSLFGVKSHDYEMLQLWRKAIPRRDKEFGFLNKVCELHFQENDIERQFVHKMPDGSIHTIERERSALRPGAVPSIFPILPSYLSEKSRSRKSPALRVLIPKEKKKVEMGKIVCIVPGCQSDYSSLRKIRFKTEGNRNISLFLPPRDPDLFEKWRRAIPANDFDLKKTDHVCELHFLEDEIERFYITKLKDGSINKIEKGKVTLKAGAIPSVFPYSSENVENEMLSRNQPTTKHTVVETPEDNLSSITNLKENTIVKNFSYEKLLRTVMSMKKPSNFWSITATSNFIIFARWNEDYIPEKRIVIEKNLNARVYLRENEIKGTDLLEITNDDDIITLLQKVESYKFYTEASDDGY